MPDATPEQIVAFMTGAKAMTDIGREDGFRPDIVERLRGRLPYEEYSWDLAQEAAAEIAKLREENGRLQTPICIGQPIIQTLARDGAWKSDDGSMAVIAADELFRNDPYAEIAKWREECERLRAVLQQIADDATPDNDNYGSEIARRALEPKP